MIGIFNYLISKELPRLLYLKSNKWKFLDTSMKIQIQLRLCIYAEIQLKLGNSCREVHWNKGIYAEKLLKEFILKIKL